jgi:phosphate transport system substrate-binding protein
MRSFRIHAITTVAVGAIAVLVAACGSSNNNNSSGGSGGGSGGSNLSGTLNASGSSFQLTFQQAAIQGFKSVQPNMTVNYGGGGSGKGRTDLAAGTVQFAGSDSPIPADEKSSFKGKKVLYFPVVIGPITLSYNLSGVHNLKLTPPVVANIFQGKIKTWNDSAIKSINPGVHLPSTSITIARRSDSSGTTENFSQFLVEAAPGVWHLGSNSTINWPAASRGGNGNGGVAQIVKSTPGAIGYVDYADARASGLTFASVKNKDGNFIAPTTQSASAAASKASVAPNLTVSAIWAPGASSYPITYQSWVLADQHQSSASTGKMLRAYIGYLVGAGQKMLPQLHYAPLPANIDQKAKAELSKIGSSS